MLSGPGDFPGGPPSRGTPGGKGITQMCSLQEVVVLVASEKLLTPPPRREL